MRLSKSSSVLLVIFCCFIGSMMLAGAESNEKQAVEKSEYQLFYQELTKLFREKKSKDAVKLIEQNLDKFPERIEAMSYNMAYFCGQLNNFKKGIKYLKKAHKKGYWFNPWALNGPAFQPYKKLKSFEKILKKNNELKNAAEKKAKYQIRIVLPEAYDGNKKYPLFIALHGGGGNLKTFPGQWQSGKMKREYIVAYIQSSQMASMKSFHWEDAVKSRADVSNAYQEILQKHLIDEGQTVIGGFSSGGRASLILSFFEVVPVKGFIVLCPPVPENITEKEIEVLKNKGVRGTIITTGRDPRIKEQKGLIKKFKKAGLQYQFSFSKNDGHWYPKDLSGRIDQALDHINNQ